MNAEFVLRNSNRVKVRTLPAWEAAERKKSPPDPEIKREGGLFLNVNSVRSDAEHGAIYEFAAEAPNDFTALASLS